MISEGKHVTLSVKEKIEVIKSLKAGYTVTALSEKYVGKSTIYDFSKIEKMLTKEDFSGNYFHKEHLLTNLKLQLKVEELVRSELHLCLVLMFLGE